MAPKAREKGLKNVSKAAPKASTSKSYVYPETPPGEKKRLPLKMPMTYSPSAVETSWYAWWEKSNFFVPDPTSSKNPFVMGLPPPNVTGALHLGHALTAAIEDTLIRWRRMSGCNTLWDPAMDHAGIATQVAVEKKIMRDRKLTRHDIGRTKFVSEVYLHPMICDAHEHRMSKSLGNGIDPLDVVKGITLDGLLKILKECDLDGEQFEKAREGLAKDFPKGIPECGTDALRFALVSSACQGDKINLDIQRVVGYRQWCDKLWNTTRVAISILGESYTPPTVEVPFSCQWILSALHRATVRTISSLESYDLPAAATTIYSWWQFQLSDVFIEVTKPYFISDDPKSADARRFAQDTLCFCLDNGLRLLHPFMPFITEELWQQLPASTSSLKKQSIVISDYPSVERWNIDTVELLMDNISSILEGLRLTRQLLPPSERLERLAAFVLCGTNEIVDVLKGSEAEICALGTLASLEVSSDSGAAPHHWMTEVVDESITVFLEGKEASIFREAEEQAATFHRHLEGLGMKFSPTDWELILIYKWKVEGKQIPRVPVYDLDLYAVSPVNLLDRLPAEEGGRVYIFTPLHKISSGKFQRKRDAIGGTWSANDKGFIKDGHGVFVGFKRSFTFEFGEKKPSDGRRYLMTEYTIEDADTSALSVVYGVPKGKDEVYLAFSDWAATMAAKYNIVSGNAGDDRAALPDLNLPPL